MAAALIGTAAAAIAAGSSLAGTTITALTASAGYSVACGLEVQNWTKYPLVEPMAFTDGGLIQTPPVLILPGHMEAMVGHKRNWAVAGTEGTVSWLVQKEKHKPQRIVIMWSTPYNLGYDNKLALGITKEGDTRHEREYFDMMYDPEALGLPFFSKVKIFDTDANTFSMHDANFEIEAGMGTTQITTAKIIVKPYHVGEPDYDEYAPSIVQSLNV